jgi:hypothetical protein
MEELDLGIIIAEYRPFSPEEFAKSVRKRQFAQPKWLYSDLSRDPEPWQGDILPDMELAFIDANGEVLVYEGWAMVLSHGCDTVPGRDEVATLAPVFALEQYLARVPAEEQRQRAVNVRGNILSNVLYLPQYGPIPESCVDFSFASAVSTRRIERACKEASSGQRLRLSSEGWYLLTAKLAHHCARAERASDYPRRSIQSPPVKPILDLISRPNPWPERSEADK